MDTDDVSRPLPSLSGAARRVVEILAGADAPLSYEVVRHILRVTEGDMIDALAEAVQAGLVRRAPGPGIAYELTPDAAASVMQSLDVGRREKLRRQVEAARERVHGPAEGRPS